MHASKDTEFTIIPRFIIITQDWNCIFVYVNQKHGIQRIIVLNTWINIL